jgi:hypothetical protein
LQITEQSFNFINNDLSSESSSFIPLRLFQESEAHDRESLALPGNQDLLVATVAAAAKSPIVVVVMTGGAVDLTAIKNNDNVGAIVWCGYPGQSGGQAIADVLWGTVNPGMEGERRVLGRGEWVLCILF